MSEIINLIPGDEKQAPAVSRQSEELMEIADGILLDTRSSLDNKIAMTMPIAQLATLGAGVSSLLPAFKTVTQTSAVAADGLYRVANAGVGDVLKAAKDGTFWGAFKTSNGASKMAKLESVSDLTSTTTSVAAINPATIMMAVALFSIEQKLGSIAEMEQQILSFLEIEKESEIEADIETLSAVINKYKYNWDNEHFIASNHKLVIDIQRTARKHMNTYQKQVSDILSSKKRIVSQSKVNDTLNDLLRKFKYYRLTMFTFSMASFMEVMLSGDFKEENILLVKSELEKLSVTYREIFSRCSMYLEELSDASVETTLLKGVGTVSKAAGKFIDAIPKIRDGLVDEFLLERGTKLYGDAARIERQAVETFAEISNPGVWMFIEKLNDMIQIFGRTEEICFDDKNIYLIAG